MKTRIDNKLAKQTAVVAALILLAVLLFIGNFANAAPQGAGISVVTTENGTVRSADSHTAQGGSFTTLLLNVTSQTSKWKAYVGNVTGSITLDSTNNRSIYSWTMTTVQGEVYVSRNDSVTFSSLACANAANITAEHTALSINASSDDSINNTFRNTVHRSFVIGGTGTIANSTCPAIATWVNDTAQASSENAAFREVLLTDGRNVVYTTLLENKRSGFDNSSYDFQLIVPDIPDDTVTTYYFYAELG